jgi:hypothetical protein
MLYLLDLTFWLFVSDLRQHCHRLVVFSGTPVSSTNKTDTQYSWNIVESGIKHHNPNPIMTDYCWSTLKYLVLCGKYFFLILYCINNVFLALSQLIIGFEYTSESLEQTNLDLHSSIFVLLDYLQ